MFKKPFFVAGTLAIFCAALFLGTRTHAVTLPEPSTRDDAGLAQGSDDQSIVLAGGCFWGMQEIFQHVKGVTKVVAGYAGGAEGTAHYETVSTGTTGHAESVKVTYDPLLISLPKILQIYFSVAHNPTELNYQGPDHGTQYRSAIFYKNPEQQKVADDYIAQIQNAGAFSESIVTKLEPLTGFYPAEAYHQNYAELHPDNLYLKINDTPKVEALQKQFPQLYK